MSSTTTQFAKDKGSNLKGVPFAVSTPFVSDPGADIVLRSCDKHEFRARKAILSFASSFFNDMFSLPQPTERESEISTDDPIELSETGRVIDALLRYCYPLPNPPIEDIVFADLVLRAAEKYDITIAVSGVIAVIHDHRLARPDFLLFLYRRACQCDLQSETEARDYAWDCLKLSYPLLVKYGQGSPLDNTLPHLIEYYHGVCGRVADRVSNFYHISSLPTSKRMWGPCSTCNVSEGSSEPTWWKDSLSSMVQKIYKNGPRSGSDICPKPGIYSLKCLICLRTILQYWDSFREELNNTLEEEAKSVYQIYFTRLLSELTRLNCLILLKRLSSSFLGKKPRSD